MLIKRLVEEIFQVFMDREALGNKLLYAYPLLEVWIELNQSLSPQLFIFDRLADLVLDSFIFYGNKALKITFVATLQAFI